MSGTASSAELTGNELDELVSHVLSLRKDFVQALLKEAGVERDDRMRPKADLRQTLRDQIASGELEIERVIQFLNEREPGGKQHVFLFRPSKEINDRWKDLDKARRRLRRRKTLRELIDAELPLVMPSALQVASLHFGEEEFELVAVEARRYTERDESYDGSRISEEGLPVELRAWVHRVARSTVVLRWDLKRRVAALHITQATQQGVPRAYYRDVLRRLSAVVGPWLDLGKFEDVDLHKVIDKLQRLERGGGQALTKSRRGDWETDYGSKVQARSASASESMFTDQKLVAAVDKVADPTSGQSTSMYWLSSQANPLEDDLHLSIVASDSRIHFRKPSSKEAVEHVIGEIRRLL